MTSARRSRGEPSLNHAEYAGDYAAAEEGFRRVLNSAPDNIGALGNLGVVYSRTNRLTDAEVDEVIDVVRKAL